MAKVFDLTAAATGANEKTLLRRGLMKGKDYESLIITQNSHAGYYPGAKPMTLKLLWVPETGEPGLCPPAQPFLSADDGGL